MNWHLIWTRSSKMKTLIMTFLILAAGLQSFSQTALLRGRITDSTGRGYIQDARIHFLKNDTTILSDFGGSYRIELSRSFDDTIVVSHWKYGTVTVPIALWDHAVKELDISFPAPCKSFPKTDICPKCKTNSNSIKIVYGYPAKETFEKAERGEIKLGGCVINDCMPYYHCKKDVIDY